MNPLKSPSFILYGVMKMSCYGNTCGGNVRGYTPTNSMGKLATYSASPTAYGANAGYQGSLAQTNPQARWDAYTPKPESSTLHELAAQSKAPYNPMNRIAQSETNTQEQLNNQPPIDPVENIAARIGYLGRDYSARHAPSQTELTDQRNNLNQKLALASPSLN